MFKLHLKNPQTVVKNGQEMLLNQPLYNVVDRSFLTQNGFFQCAKCKDWFDEACEFGIYHPQRDEKDYCETCYSIVDHHKTSVEM